MRQGRVQISVTAGFYILMAISLCTLPLKWVGSWLLAMMVHEFCHCIAVIGCGSDLRKIKLTVFGAEIVADISSAGREMICSLAGPIGGLLLLMFRKLIPITALCAYVHSVYNLLPLAGLDGGRALYSLLHMCIQEERAEKACEIIDRIVRILLLIAALCAAWRMRWCALAVFAVIFLFGRRRIIKFTCKRKRLQVQ